MVSATLTTTLLVLTVLPWARSGQRERNSYALVDSAGASGVVPEHLESAIGLWYLVPVAGGIALIGEALGARRSAGVAVATLGAAVTVFAIQVDRSPLVSLGATQTAIAVGVVAIAWGVAVAVFGRQWNARRNSP